MRPSAPTRRASTTSPESSEATSAALIAEPSGPLAQPARGSAEDPLDVGLGSAWPHDVRARAPPEQQVERMREHGLAGAGLAGEHVQTGSEAQVRPLDQQQVLDVELFEHRSRAGLPARGDGVGARIQCWPREGAGRIISGKGPEKEIRRDD